MVDHILNCLYFVLKEKYIQIHMKKLKFFFFLFVVFLHVK